MKTKNTFSLSQCSKYKLNKRLLVNELNVIKIRNYMLSSITNYIYIIYICSFCF